MPDTSLTQDWCIRVIVTADNASHLDQTLAALSRHSLSSDLAVLACDNQAVHEALANTTLPVHYNLPSTIPAQAYWSTIRAASMEPKRTIFLQAGTSVPEHWDARLAAVGQGLPQAAAIAPLSARHPMTSVFTDCNHRPGLEADALDQWLNDYSDGAAFPIPVLPQTCLLVQGHCWKSVPGSIVTDESLMSHLRECGAVVLASKQVYVDDSAVGDEHDLSHLPRALTDASTLRSPLAPLRHALTELSQRTEQPPELRHCLPVQLHIGHSWGGGLGRWMEDFIAADTEHNHLVLRSIGDFTGFGLTIGLYRSMALEAPIRTWTLHEPILSLSLASHEYRNIIAELVEDFHVESLVVSSLIGHSLDLLTTELPTTLVLHDFFPYCPALYATFDQPCLSCSPERMAECARDNPQHNYFKFESTQHWQAARQQFLRLVQQRDITLVAPSASVVQRYRELVPDLAGRDMHVIPHGLDEQLIASLEGDTAAARGERLQVVVTGRLTAEKGADILNAVLDAFAGQVDFHLLGTGEGGSSFEGKPGVSVERAYNKDELGNLLRAINADVAMLLSVVPETFSYTLSELHAAGIPVVSTRVGAFIERIQEGDNGWLVEPDPDSVISRLRQLQGNRAALATARDYLASQSARTTGAMARDYAVLDTGQAGIALHRYDLPRRTFSNPYLAQGETLSGALYIGHQVPYRQVLAEFLRYSAGKMDHSPRVPRPLGRLSAAILRRLARRLSS